MPNAIWVTHVICERVRLAASPRDSTVKCAILLLVNMLSCVVCVTAAVVRRVFAVCRLVGVVWYLSLDLCTATTCCTLMHIRQRAPQCPVSQHTSRRHPTGYCCELCVKHATFTLIVFRRCLFRTHKVAARLRFAITLSICVQCPPPPPPPWPCW